jgi:cell division septation protein DedD
MSSPDRDIGAQCPTTTGEVPPGPVDVAVRDLDRIRERITVTIEPSHAIWAAAAVAGLLAIALLVGMHVGGGREATGREPAGGVAGVMTASSESTPTLGTAPVVETPASKPRPAASRGSFASSVLPAPRPPEATARAEDLDGVAMLARRGLVTVPFPPPDPRAADTVAALTVSRRDLADVPVPPEDPVWPSLAVTDLAWCASCTAADGECGPYVLARTPEPVPEPVPAPAPSHARKAEKPAKAEQAGPGFAVQVSSYREVEVARETASALRAKGYKARVVEFTDAAGATWYRVRIGKFDSASGAGEFASRFNAREGEHAIPVPGEKR